MSDLSIVFGTIGASQMISDIMRLEGKALSLGGVFSSVAKSLTGPASIAAIGTVIKDVAVGSVKAFAEFETAYQSLSAITGATGKDLDFFKDQAREIGETTTTSATEAVKAFELIGSAMPKLLGDSKALVQMTKDVQLLADASGMALPDATQAATSALNQYGAAADQAGRFVNVLAAGALEGSSSILQSTQALERFGSIAAGANVSIEESIGLVQQLATKSLYGAEAGTALRTILLKLSNAQILPPNAQADMKRLGINTKLVADANVPLALRLKEVGKAFNDTGALTHIFEEANVNAAKTILGNIDGYTTLTGKITGTGVAAVQAAKNTATMAAQWKKIQNQIEIAMIGIGESMKPVIDDILKGFKPAFEAVMDLVKSVLSPFKEIAMNLVSLGKSFGIVSENASNFEGIVKMLTTGIGLLLIPSRAIYWVISKMIGFVDMGVKSFQSFSEKMPILGTAIKILLGPIGMLGDAIGFVTGLINGESGGISAMEQYTATMAYAGKEVLKLGQANGLSIAEIKAFTKQVDLSRYAGLTQVEATKKMAGDMRNYALVARATADANKVVTSAVDETTNSLKNQTKAVEEAQFGFVGMAEGHLLQSAMDHMNAEKDRAAAVAATKKEIDDLAYVMAEGANQTDAMVMQVSASIPKITELQMSLIGLKKTLIEDLTGAFVDFAATAAFAFGEAINGGKNLGQVMSQLLVGLGSTIAKLAGMALLNASVALGPTPAALAMAIAGIGLIGLSGILSSVGKKDAARFDRGDNPQGSTTSAIPQQSPRGLDGATGGSDVPWVIQLDGPNGEVLSGYMRRQMRKDDIRRG